MFRSQTDHHQGGTIFLLTSVTKFYFILLMYLPDDGQSVTETCRRSLEFKQYKCFNVLFIKKMTISAISWNINK